MSKTIKLISILMIALMIISVSTQCFAKDVLDKVNPDATKVETTAAIETVGKILGLVQVIAALLGVVLIAFMGIKFMIGSAEEKAEYKKSFLPLIIGIIVVMGATSIAKLLFNVFAE